MSKNQKMGTEQRYQRTLDQAWRSLAVAADRVENARANVWALRAGQKHNSKRKDGSEFPHRVLCAKTGAFIRRVSSRDIAQLVELHGEESAASFLQAECVSVAPAWKFEKTGTLRKLAQHDPAGFFVYAISKFTGLHAIDSRDSIETRYKKTLAKHALYSAFIRIAHRDISDYRQQFDTLTHINEYLRRILALTSSRNADKYIGASNIREIIEAVNPFDLAPLQTAISNALATLVRAFLLKNRNNRRILHTYGLSRHTMHRIALEFDGDSRYAETFFDSRSGDGNRDTYDMLDFLMVDGFDMEFAAIAEENEKSLRNKRARAAELRKRVQERETGKTRKIAPTMFDSFDFDMSVDLAEAQAADDDSDDSDDSGMFEGMDGFSIVDGEDLDSDERIEDEAYGQAAPVDAQLPRPQSRPSLAALDFSNTARKDDGLNALILSKLRKG